MLLKYLLPLLLLSSAAIAQDKSEDLLKGKSLFMIHCSRCHGVLGNGGTGPSLARPYLPRASTDEKLSMIIASGIEGTAMPGNWALQKNDIASVVTYVRSLAGNEAEGAGDAVRGRDLFAESICGTCHMVSGEGGSVGPDLTLVGQRRGRRFMTGAITHPAQSKIKDSNGFYKFLMVRINLNDGTTMSGLRVNEDTFSIQVKDADNEFHTFRKSEISSIEKMFEQSIMPSFADQFSEEDINDIVAYLSSLK